MWHYMCSLCLFWLVNCIFHPSETPNAILFLLSTESVEVIDGFGIQLSSRARFGKENKTFFEFSAVNDIIINEAVKMVHI